jgi:hypothetical protein
VRISSRQLKIVIIAEWNCSRVLVSFSRCLYSLPSTGLSSGHGQQFFSSPLCPNRFRWPTQPPGVQRPVHKAHSSPRSGDFKIIWSFAFSLPIHVYGVIIFLVLVVVVCSLFNGAFSASQTIKRRTKGWYASVKLERMCKKAVVA